MPKSNNNQFWDWVKKYSQNNSKILQYLGDLPERDRTALATSMIPGVGDVAGVRADIMNMVENPDQRNLTNMVWLGAGALPFVPSRSQVKLPMDAISRAARADDMGFTKDVYHGTHADFDQFDYGDLGYHVGTPEQAGSRLVDVESTRQTGRAGFRGGKSYGDGAQIMPLKAKINNPLDVDDVGDWKDPYQVSTGLLDTPFGAKHREELLNLQDDMTPEMESFAFGEEDWRDSPEAEEFMDEIRGMLKADGYDSVRYKNQVENKYGDLAGITPQAEKKVKELQAEIKKISDAAYQRAPKPPSTETATPEEIEAWINRPRGPNEQESKRILELKQKISEIQESGAYDPHSYILLDGNQLRSKNATFDPDNADSADLLAGLYQGGNGYA